MSQTSQSVRLPHATLSPELIKSLTEKLQEVAQTLAALCQEKPSEPAPPDDPTPDEETGQIRCYRVPDFMVAEEREILNHSTKPMTW